MTFQIDMSESSKRMLCACVGHYDPYESISVEQEIATHEFIDAAIKEHEEFIAKLKALRTEVKPNGMLL